MAKRRRVRDVKVRFEGALAATLDSAAERLGQSRAELLRSAWSEHLKTLRATYDLPVDEDEEEDD